MIHGVSYFGERDVSVVTLVSESETMCVLQLEKICFKKNRSQCLSNYCRIYLGQKISCCSKSNLSNSSRRVGNRNRGLLAASNYGGGSSPEPLG